MYPTQCIEQHPILWRGDIEAGHACPVYLMPEFDHYFTAWVMFEKGVLPIEGGWTQQPNHWIQAIETIGGQMARWQREQLIQRQAEQD